MEDYKVRLDQFEGPLDLLLYLIRRAEVDVTSISLARITEQYLAFLDQIHDVDVDNAGEFLVTAATLVELKSRLVSPPDPEASIAGTEGGEAGEALAPSARARPGVPDDPAAELIRQLLAYKKIRDAAHALEARRAAWERSYPAARAPLDPNAPPEPEDVSIDVEDLVLYDLIEAYRRIIETVQFDRLGAHEVTYDDTPIELHAEDLLDQLRRDAEAKATSGPEAASSGMSLRAIFRGRTRGEMIGLFLATLELVRQRKVAVYQEAAGGDILIRLEAVAATSVPTPL